MDGLTDCYLIQRVVYICGCVGNKTVLWIDVTLSEVQTLQIAESLFLFTVVLIKNHFLKKISSSMFFTMKFNRPLIFVIRLILSHAQNRTSTLQQGSYVWSRAEHLEKFSLIFSTCRSSSSLTILVLLGFIIISLVFFLSQLTAILRFTSS